MVGSPQLTKQEPKQTEGEERPGLGVDITWPGMADACSGLENGQEMKVAPQTRSKSRTAWSTKLRDSGFV